MKGRAIVGEPCPFCGRRILAVETLGRPGRPDVITIHHDDDAAAWRRGEPTRTCAVIGRVLELVNA